jgi:hypothetical protein
LEVVQIPYFALPKQFFEVSPESEGVGRRAEHCHQVGVFLRSCQHGAGVSGDFSSSITAKHMLSGVKGRDRDRCVKLGRRADPDDIQIGSLDDVLPIAGDFGNAKLFCDCLGCLSATIADDRNFDAGDVTQTKQVPKPDNAASADNADS